MEGPYSNQKTETTPLIGPALCKQPDGLTNIGAATQYETDNTQQPLQDRWNSGRTPVSSLFGRLPQVTFSKKLTNSVLAVGTVVLMVAYQVAIPLYTGAFSAPETGSDAYIAILLAQIWIPLIFFALVFLLKVCIDWRIALKPQATWSNIFLAGFTMGINGVLLGLSSPPNRTPPQLQALLQTLLIPSTVLARFIVMRKGISRSQSVCILCLFAGLIISLEPTIFGFEGGTSATPPWYFTAIFGLSWLPVAFGYVFVEQGQTGSDDSLVYMAWLQVFIYTSYVTFTWVDFIPGFGMAKNPKDFFHKLSRGFTCLYGADNSCSYVMITAGAYISSFVVANMFNLLLIRYAESAVYSVVVLALVTPISTLFWTLFSTSPVLHWNPVFNSSTIYLLVGLAIMTPSVVMYTIFSSEVAPAVRTDVVVQENADRGTTENYGATISLNKDTGEDDDTQKPVRRICSAPVMDTINEF